MPLSLRTCLLFGFLLVTSFLRGNGQSTIEKVTFLGVSASPLPARMSEQMNLPAGVYLSVDQVSDESPAAKAGLKLYDVLLQFNDQILVNSEQLKALVRMKKPGDQVNLKILRKGNPVTLTANLSEIEQPNPINQSSRSMLRDIDTFSHDPFFHDIDNIIPNLDPSMRDLLKRHRLSPFRNNLNPGTGFDSDNPLHGPNLNSQDVQSFSFSSEQKKIITSDDQGTFEYSEMDDQKYFKAISPDGEILFDGPVTSEDDRKKLPANLKERLQKIENNI